MSQLLWEKSQAWRWIVRRTRESKPFFYAFATVCGVIPGVVGYCVMQFTSSGNPELEAKLRNSARPESVVDLIGRYTFRLTLEKSDLDIFSDTIGHGMMAKVNQERLGEYLAELKNKENTNDRYVAALRGETLTRNPYQRIQPIPKPSTINDKEEQK